jgi:hypothetical protein
MDQAELQELIHHAHDAVERRQGALEEELNAWITSRTSPSVAANICAISGTGRP